MKPTVCQFEWLVAKHERRNEPLKNRFILRVGDPYNERIFSIGKHAFVVRPLAFTERSTKSTVVKAPDL
jgi:hypothetical protein